MKISGFKAQKLEMKVSKCAASFYNSCSHLNICIRLLMIFSKGTFQLLKICNKQKCNKLRKCCPWALEIFIENHAANFQLICYTIWCLQYLLSQIHIGMISFWWTKQYLCNKHTCIHKLLSDVFSYWNM